MFTQVVKWANILAFQEFLAHQRMHPHFLTEFSLFFLTMSVHITAFLMKFHWSHSNEWLSDTKAHLKNNYLFGGKPLQCTQPKNWLVIQLLHWNVTVNLMFTSSLIVSHLLSLENFLKENYVFLNLSFSDFWYPYFSFIITLLLALENVLPFILCHLKEIVSLTLQVFLAFVF